MIIRKMKSKIQRLKPFIKDFNTFIKQFYHIVWSAKKRADSKNKRTVKTKNGRIILLPDCAVCNSKKSRFIKE